MVHEQPLASKKCPLGKLKQTLPAGAPALGFWESDNQWYPCTLLGWRSSDGLPKVLWEDGTCSRLGVEQVRPVPPPPLEEGGGRRRLREGETCGDEVLQKRARVMEELTGSPPHALVPPPRHTLPEHRYVMAPMVGGSELPFRMLARRYGAQLCYTPMIYSGPFATDPAYRAAPEHGFQTCPGDRPLVAHFCGNDPEVLLEAARHVAKQVDAVDLNLGCPQRIAHAEHFGAYLLGEEDRELVCRIIRRLADALPVPVFCKIRLLDELEDTVQLVQQLEASGASLIAVHARYRGSPTHRRDGPAHLDQVAVIKKVVRVPVLANGNVRSWHDVHANLVTTGADGIMSAEGILDDPCIFAGPSGVAGQQQLRKVEKKLRQIQVLRQRAAGGGQLTAEEAQKVGQRKVLRAQRQELRARVGDVNSNTEHEVLRDGVEKAKKYLEMARRYWMPPVSTVVFHCRRMAKDQLTQYQMMEEFKAAQTLEAVEEMLARAEGYRDKPGSFEADAGRAQRERELRSRKLYEEECRKKYEARMARKAQRTGQPLSELLKSTSCPGGLLTFSSEPVWLQERDDEPAVQPSTQRGARGRGGRSGRGGVGHAAVLGRGRGRGHVGSPKEHLRSEGA